MRLETSPMIEFVGGPGSGKTTITKDVIVQLSRKGIQVDTYIGRIVSSGEKSEYFYRLSKWKRYSFYTVGALVNLHNILYICCLVLSSRQLNGRTFYASWSLVRMFISVETISRLRSKAGALIFDRGYVNAIVTLIYRDRFSDALLNKLVSVVYRRHFVAFVILNTSIDESIARIAKRAPKGDYIESLSQEDARKDYHLRQKSIERLLQIISVENNSPQFHLSGAQTITYNAERVCGFVLNVFANREK